MLLEFNFTNFHSFKEKTILDFAFPKKLDAFPGFVFYPGSGKKNQFISNVVGVFGANASGKSNLLKSLDFCFGIMLNSFSQGFGYVPFMENHENSQFELIFTDFEWEYRYFLEIDRRVIHKEFFGRKKIGTKGKPKRIFERNFGRKSILENDFEILGDIDLVTKNRTDAGIFSTGLQAFQNNFLTNVISSSFGNNFLQKAAINQASFNPSLPQSRLQYIQNQDLLDRAISILKKFDTGLENIEIKKTFTPEGYPTYRFMEVKEYEGKTIAWDMDFYSSRGTLDMFNALSEILNALESGGIYLFDETNSLHPRLEEEIITWFLDKDVNETGAQLIFSSHNPGIMNLLSKEQIYFTEKIDSQSYLYSLCDFDKNSVKIQDDFAKKYLSGKYGGIPKIRHF